MRSALLRSVGRRLLTHRGSLAKAIAILCLVPVLLCVSCDSTADKDAYKKIGLSCGADGEAPPAAEEASRQRGSGAIGDPKGAGIAMPRRWEDLRRNSAGL